ncbi:MAG: hypothetical protein GYB68_00605 [Chloroflexi bacterium]|nr:hypothetical protein [Chloroflexota bacterium]
MACTVELLPDIPAVLLTFTGVYDVDEARQASDHVHELTQHMDGPLYRISDVSALAWSWDEMVQGFSHHIQHAPGSISDPKFVPMLVGGGHMSEIFAQGMQEEVYGGVKTYVFSTIDDALAFIHEEIGV